MNELQKKLGELLEIERERRGVALADLSNELKISEDNLASIEAGNVSALPSELYYNLFAKSYAEYLGIDYSKTIEAIREEIGESLEPVDDTDRDSNGYEIDRSGLGDAETESAESDKQDVSFSRRAIILAAIIMGAFVVLLVGYKLLFRVDTSTIANDSDEPGVIFSTESMTEKSPSSTAFASYVWAAPERVDPDSLRLTLTAHEESWATVLADGDTAIYQNLTPWREYEVGAKYRLVVSVGIPRVTETKLNGEPVYLASPQTGRISRVEINQTNRDRFSSPPPRRPRLPETPASSPDEAIPESTGAAEQDEPTVIDSV